MPNPNHYPSLELCQRLKELGWKQETEIVWCQAAGALTRFVGKECDKDIPAPSVAEMLDQLGRGVRRVEFGPKATWVFPFDGNGDDCSNCDSSLSRADQLATCLINLAERGEITM
ncbi:MAG: hypothetical protein M0R37_14935 [Bacteroidales bacterium]|jgi:hypothetical protein|nr:hypothetical protein [Bacteroidales bacterium]